MLNSMEICVRTAEDIDDRHGEQAATLFQGMVH